MPPRETRNAKDPGIEMLQEKIGADVWVIDMTRKVGNLSCSFERCQGGVGLSRPRH